MPEIEAWTSPLDEDDGLSLAAGSLPFGPVVTDLDPKPTVFIEIWRKWDSHYLSRLDFDKQSLRRSEDGKIKRMPGITSTSHHMVSDFTLD